MKRITTISAAILAAFTLGSGTSYADGLDHYMIVNCTHSDLSKENTKDLVYVEFWAKGERVYRTRKNSRHNTGWNFGMVGEWYGITDTSQKVQSPQCGTQYDALFGTDSFDYDKDKHPAITHVVLRATGTDAFFIDQAYYGNNTGEGKKSQRWGNKNNGGWCLSNDPKDGKNSWKKIVSGCYPWLRFELSTGNVYREKRP